MQCVGNHRATTCELLFAPISQCVSCHALLVALLLHQGSEVAAEQHIIDMMGGLYAPFMLGGLKFGSWMKRVLLRQSSISQAVDTLHTIARVGLVGGTLLGLGRANLSAWGPGTWCWG